MANFSPNMRDFVFTRRKNFDMKIKVGLLDFFSFLLLAYVYKNPSFTFGFNSIVTLCIVSLDFDTHLFEIGWPYLETVQVLLVVLR